MKCFCKFILKINIFKAGINCLAKTRAAIFPTNEMVEVSHKTVKYHPMYNSDGDVRRPFWGLNKLRSEDFWGL